MPEPEYTTRKLHGGIVFDKAAAPTIERFPTPETLRIPLVQHQGTSAKIVVQKNQHVKKGQALSASDDLSQLPVHASCSGAVQAIDQQSITIENDGSDDEIPRTQESAHIQLTRDQLIQLLHQCGIAGMGGAGFPTAKKIAALPLSANLLLVNAAECDPIIHCDDALMQRSADEILTGAEVLASACNLGTVVIAIEDNKPAATRAISRALKKIELNARIFTVPSRYPSGAEQLLASLCFDSFQQHNNQPGKSLAGNGILSVNVATCHAIYCAVTRKQPLTSRITSVIDSNGSVRNFELPIGTSISDISKHLNTNRDIPSPHQHDRITSGGQMMYKEISFNSSVIKTSNSIAFAPAQSNPQNIRACIRCGACAAVCPELLLPQQLHLHATSKNPAELTHYKLSNCIECGCCDVVCPSHIPLTSSFQQAKRQLAANAEANLMAATAKARYERRQRRLENKDELKKRRSATPDEISPDTVSDASTTETPQTNKQLIEAALKRRKNRQQGQGDGT